jgi:hypothetical protein
MVKENYKNRTIAYQVFYIREKILQYKKIDGDTVEGKEFARKWSLDITFSPMKKVNYDTKSAILNLENQLNTEPYKSINEQFNSLKGKYDWYTLDTKRATFYGLCEYLGYPVSYDFFYKQWSELLHGKSAYRDNLANQDGKGGIEAIRSLANYKTVIGVLIPFIMECYMNIFKVLFPSYHIRMIRYYRNILKPKFDKFNTTNIEMIDQY